MQKIDSADEMPASDFPCHGDLYSTKRLIAAAFKVWSLKRGIDPENYYEGPNWFKQKRAWKETTMTRRRGIAARRTPFASANDLIITRSSLRR